MATRSAPNLDVLDLDGNLPAGYLYNVWTPIIAAVLSAILSVIVILQE